MNNTSNIRSRIVLYLFVLPLLLFSCSDKEEPDPCGGEATVTVVNNTSHPGIYVQINAGSVNYVTDQETFTYIVDLNELAISANLENEFLGWKEKLYFTDECDHTKSTWNDSDFE
jgi:hypothetical protein